MREAAKKDADPVVLEGEETNPHRSYDFTAGQKILINLLGSSFEMMLEDCFVNLPQGPYPLGFPLDLLLLPHSWKEEIRILELGFPQKDPNFWQNVKREAVRL
jgi:hypothetical protein